MKWRERETETERNTKIQGMKLIEKRTNRDREMHKEKKCFIEQRTEHILLMSDIIKG